MFDVLIVLLKFDVSFLLDWNTELCFTSEFDNFEWLELNLLFKVDVKSELLLYLLMPYPLLSTVSCPFSVFFEDPRLATSIGASRGVFGSFTSTNQGEFGTFSPLNLTSTLCLPGSWGMKFAWNCSLEMVWTWLVTRPPFTIISRFPNPAPFPSTEKKGKLHR